MPGKRDNDIAKRKRAFKLLVNDYYEWFSTSGKEPKEVAASIGVADTTFRRWFNGESVPTWEGLKKLKELIGSTSAI